MPEPVRMKDLISAGISPHIHLAMVLSAVSDNWPIIVGRALGERTKPKEIDGFVLTVVAESAQAASALKFEISRIKAVIKKDYHLPVADINIVISSTKDTAPYMPVKDRKPRVPRVTDSEIEDEAANYGDVLKDRHMAMSIARMAAISKKSTPKG